MKALCLVVSEKKIFENCILKTYFLIPWPTYATNWNGLNNIDRRQLRDHSCEVWSKYNKRFQRRCCLKKLLTDERTDARTMDDGQWAITKAHLELRWAKKTKVRHWRHVLFKHYSASHFRCKDSLWVNKTWMCHTSNLTDSSNFLTENKLWHKLYLYNTVS